MMPKYFSSPRKKPLGRQQASACLVPLLVLLSLAVTGCRQPKSQPPPPANLPAEVVVTTPRAVQLPEYLEVTGRIDAERVVDIRSRVTGYLTKVAVQDGQFVSAGDSLYQIDDRPARAKLDEAVGVIERLLG